MTYPLRRVTVLLRLSAGRRLSAEFGRSADQAGTAGVGPKQPSGICGSPAALMLLGRWLRRSGRPPNLKRYGKPTREIPVDLPAAGTCSLLRDRIARENGMERPLTVGQLARASGVPAKTIRYYEQVGVLPAARRSASGYRQYIRNDVDRLVFVRRARILGLPLAQLKALTAEMGATAV